MYKQYGNLGLNQTVNKINNIHDNIWSILLPSVAELKIPRSLPMHETHKTYFHSLTREAKPGPPV